MRVHPFSIGSNCDAGRHEVRACWCNPGYECTRCHTLAPCEHGAPGGRSCDETARHHRDN